LTDLISSCRQTDRQTICTAASCRAGRIKSRRCRCRKHCHCNNAPRLTFIALYRFFSHDRYFSDVMVPPYRLVHFVSRWRHSTVGMA